MSFSQVSIAENDVRGGSFGTASSLVALAASMVALGFLESEPITVRQGASGPMTATRDALLSVFDKDESYKVTLKDDDRSVVTAATIKAAILAADWSGNGAIILDGRRRGMASILASLVFGEDIEPSLVTVDVDDDEAARDFALKANTAKEATLLLDREQKWQALLHKRSIGTYAEKATAIQRMLGTSYGVAQTLEALLALHIHGVNVTTDIVKKGRKGLADAAKLAKAGDTVEATALLAKPADNTAKVMSGADIRAAHDAATGTMKTVLGYIVGNAPESLLAFVKAETDKASKAKADKAKAK